MYDLFQNETYAFGKPRLIVIVVITGGGGVSKKLETVFTLL